MAVTKLYLIRHAEAEGNLYRRLHGWYDSAITENGYRQIAALEQRFQNIPVHAVYASDLFRTRATAAAISRPKGLEIKPRQALREIHVGEWEDIPFGQVAQQYPEQFELFLHNRPAFAVRGSESFQQLQERVCAAILRVAQANPGRTAAIFSHGVAIRNALGRFLDIPPEQLGERLPHGDNTAVSLLEIEDGRIHVAFYNDNSHLTPELSTFARQMWWRKQAKIQDANLWFRPLDMETQSQVYYDARQEAWLDIHGSMLHFDGEGFLRDAGEQARYDKNSVLQVLQGGEPAGVLQLNLRREAEKGVGYIPFLYLLPPFRGKGLGVQLLGQAVSVYRPLGRQYLRLRCAPDNRIAQRFYRKYGFYKVGQDPGSRVPLDILEKYIGFEQDEH
ncbi:MAG: bifunctional histidine phosphatase family protein/GNAT family N-acetyltransferase [Oscillospiraceae bacterium]|nr:bifunctional histidine phosphatase family protein/GNAT family N-acetyltransferase [Oscillospiraceae bacterium]